MHHCPVELNFLMSKEDNGSAKKRGESTKPRVRRTSHGVRAVISTDSNSGSRKMPRRAASSSVRPVIPHSNISIRRTPSNQVSDTATQPRLQRPPEVRPSNQSGHEPTTIIAADDSFLHMDPQQIVGTLVSSSNNDIPPSTSADIPRTHDPVDISLPDSTDNPRPESTPVVPEAPTPEDRVMSAERKTLSHLPAAAQAASEDLLQRFQRQHSNSSQGTDTGDNDHGTPLTETVVANKDITKMFKNNEDNRKDDSNNITASDDPNTRKANIPSNPIGTTVQISQQDHPIHHILPAHRSEQS